MALNITSIETAIVSEPATEGKAGTSAAAKRQAMGDSGKASKAVEPAEPSSTEPVEVTADTYKIDDVPMPDFTRKPFHKVSKYPWDRLEVGKSFFAPGGKKGSWSTACAKHKKDAKGAKDFKCKDWTENGVAGVRVWRVL